MLASVHSAAGFEPAELPTLMAQLQSQTLTSSAVQSAAAGHNVGTPQLFAGVQPVGEELLQSGQLDTLVQQV
eukprot:SAG31_NODE_46013_length_256_cov_0.662420_1_plen_71_part_10